MLGSLYGDLPAAAGKKAPPGAGLYDGLTGDTPAPAPFAAAARSSPPPAAEPAPSPTAAAARAIPSINLEQIKADIAKLKGRQAGVKQETTEEDAAKAADEEYDPAQPCDYDALCKERVRKRAAEEMEKRRRIEEEKLRKANEPKQEVKVEPKEDDFATKMLKKMGWKDGQGLGKDGQGITAPLMARKTDKNVAVIEQAKPKTIVKAPGTNFNREPTPVLLLTNMVGRGDVDEDLADETADEAKKYGKIEEVKVMEVDGAKDEEAVRIFIHFDRSESATKALLGFNGRFFAGRTVSARFYNEGIFKQGNLLADPNA